MKTLFSFQMSEKSNPVTQGCIIPEEENLQIKKRR
jgi:hypothetical protein